MSAELMKQEAMTSARRAACAAHNGERKMNRSGITVTALTAAVGLFAVLGGGSNVAGDSTPPAIAADAADLQSPQASSAVQGPQDSPGVRRSPVRFNAKGEMLRPTGFHEWVYVGTPLTPNDMNDGKAPFPEFHSVYMEPGAYAYYKRTGEFMDGTVMIKELVSVGSKKASSGHGYFMGDFIGLEVAMKDKIRFPKSPGNWAYFSFGHKHPLAEKTMAQPTANCNACHSALAKQDYVFTQYYPVLRAARPQQ